MAKQGRDPFSAQELKDIERILLNSVVRDSKGDIADVIVVRDKSILIKMVKTQRSTPFMTYDSFANKKLELVDETKQAELMKVLHRYAIRCGIIKVTTQPQGTGKDVQPNAKTKRVRTKVHLSAERLEELKTLDVAGNIWHVCFLRNVSDDECLHHLQQRCPNGSGKTLEQLLRVCPSECLSECCTFLDVGVETLLLTESQRMNWLIERCSKKSGWRCIYNKRVKLVTGERKRTIILDNPEHTFRLFLQLTYPARSLECKQVAYGFYNPEAMSDGFTFTHFFRTETDRRMRNLLKQKAARKVTYDDEATLKVVSVKTKQASPTKQPPTKSKDKNARQTAPSKQPSAAGRDKNAKQTSKPIHVNDFLVRKTSGHRRKGHTLEPVRATVSIMPRMGGDMKPFEFDADWCPKCRKYFMTEDTYIRLKRQGYICCKVIEEKDIGTKAAGDGFYGKLASESILHMYGYNVNQKENLSRDERQAIIAFVIENKVQTAREIAVLLEWLISQRENMPTMRVAVQRWREDLQFVRYYRTPKRRVQVDRIYAKI